MSKHTIHGMTLEVDVLQGTNLSDLGRARCVEKVVNMLRDMDSDFVRVAMANAWPVGNSKQYAEMVDQIDKALGENYTPRYSDDAYPICSIHEVK